MEVVTGRENERGRMAVPERVHLLSADDTVTQCHRYGSYLALCGALVAADSLPESLHPDDCECDTERLHCPDCVRAAHRLSAGEPGDDPEHPAWCAPQHCRLTDEGERVHQGAPVRWEDCGVRFEITLVGPEDDYRTYVELQLASLVLTSQFFYAAMPVPTARRLRDQLSAHLDAATRNWVGGLAGRVMTSSDPDVPAPGGGSDCAP